MPEKVWVASNSVARPSLYSFAYVLTSRHEQTEPDPAGSQSVSQTDRKGILNTEFVPSVASAGAAHG